MGLLDKLKRLEKEAKGDYVCIPQRDGRPLRFPKSQLADAFLNTLERAKAGGDDAPGAPPIHPLALAAANSPDPGWSGEEKFIGRAGSEGGGGKPVEDLSE